MRRIRTLAVLVAVVALAVAASPAPAAAKANKDHPVHGVIKTIDKVGNTIIVTTGGHKNKKTGETTPVVEKTFKVTDATTFVKMTGEKGAETPTTLKFDDVKEGMHVAVTVNGDVAVSVTIGHHHHGKKKPAA
jgi:hypothetical protein